MDDGMSDTPGIQDPKRGWRQRGRRSLPRLTAIPRNVVKATIAEVHTLDLWDKPDKDTNPVRVTDHIREWLDQGEYYWEEEPTEYSDHLPEPRPPKKEPEPRHKDQGEGEEEKLRPGTQDTSGNDETRLEDQDTPKDDEDRDGHTESEADDPPETEDSGPQAQDETPNAQASGEGHGAQTPNEDCGARAPDQSSPRHPDDNTNQNTRRDRSRDSEEAGPEAAQDKKENEPQASHADHNSGPQDNQDGAKRKRGPLEILYLHERAVGIGYGITPTIFEFSALNPASATLEPVPADDESVYAHHVGGDESGSEDAREAPGDGIYADHDGGDIYADHVGGNERPSDPPAEDSGPVEEDEPNGFLQEEVRGTSAELRAIEAAIEDAYGEESPYRDVGQRLLAHVYYCSTEKRYQYEEGVPIDYRLIKEACQEAGLGEVTRTSNVWWPLVDAGYMCYDDYTKGVESREFALTFGFEARLQGALEEGRDTETRYDLVTGKMRRATIKTQLTYDGDHHWSEKSELIGKAIEALRGQRDLVNIEAVEEHLSRLKARAQEAKAAYEKVAEPAKAARYEILEEGKELTGEEKERLRDAEKAACEAGRKLQREQSRYNQDNRIWSKIKGQGLEDAEDQPDGIYEYETAYDVQWKSGRWTMLVGLQNASEEMKAAACKGVRDFRNKDIKSSQTEVLIEEIQLANEMGAGLDLSAITEAPSKEEVAGHFGLSRNAPKRPEHGGKFGAMFRDDTFEEAKNNARGRVFARIKDEDGEKDWSKLHTFPFESGKVAYERAIYNELATMATVAQDWADDPKCTYDDPEAVYQQLKDFYELMTEVIDQWREWLVTVHWSEAGQHGGDGYFVENPCGLPFYLNQDDGDDDDDDDDRYDQKVAYATSRLQGRESAYMHALAILSEDYDYEFLRNEHDGAAVLGEIPEEAREEAREISGFQRARLEEKPFEGHEDCDDDDDDDSSDAHNNDQPCNTKRSKPQSKPGRTRKRSTSSTSPTRTNRNGSAAGRAGRNGADEKKTPSGSAPSRPEPSRSASAHTPTDGSASPHESQSPTQRSASKTSSGATTGTTSPADEASDGVVREDDPGPGTIVYQEGMPSSLCSGAPDPPSGSSQQKQASQHDPAGPEQAPTPRGRWAIYPP